MIPRLHQAFLHRLQRTMLRVLVQVWNLPGQLFSGERLAGLFRLFLFWLILLGLMRISRAVSAEPGIEKIPILWEQGWRFMVFPLAGFLGAFLLAGNYIRLVYQIESYRLAFQKLAAALSGFFLPRMRVANGVVEDDPEQEALINSTGGPGILLVDRGNAVMLEHLTEPTRVVGGGSHFISRFERVRDTFYLGDQESQIAPFTAATKDGIEVSIRSARYRYRIMSNRKPGDFSQRTTSQPYPFAAAGVWRAAYRRAVRREGLTPWPEAVRLAFDGGIRDYITRHLFNEVKAPDFLDPNPRNKISDDLLAQDTRQRMREIGAELLWFDVGHFDPVLDGVDEQFAQTWGAWWRGRADFELAFADAKRLSALERGRAEAQAEMLQTIIETLNTAAIGADDPARVRELVILRMAQLLDGLSDSNRLGFSGDDMAPHG